MAQECSLFNTMALDTDNEERETSSVTSPGRNEELDNIIGREDEGLAIADHLTPLTAFNHIRILVLLRRSISYN